MFKKIALVSAMSLASFGAYAMEALNDTGLEQATGQAGLTISTTLNISGAALTYTDTDGIAGTAYGTGTGGTGAAGSLNIRGLGLSSGANQIVTTIDVGANSSGQAVLQVGVSMPALTLSFSGVDVTSVGGAAPTTSNLIITPGAVSATLAAQTLTLQLGDVSPQGHMAVISDSAATSLSIGNGSANQVVVVDAANKSTTSTPGIGIGQLNVTGLDFGTTTGTGAAAADTTVDATSAGLVIGFGSAAMTNVGVAMNNVTLGETCAGIASGCTASAPIGNISISGLNMSGTKVTIAGH